MTRGKKLLILIVCLAVVGLATWGIVKLNQKEPEIIPMTQGDVIFSLGDAQEISWVYQGQEFRFRITDDPWTFLPDPQFQISKNAMANILDAITQVRIRKSLPVPEDLASYGLDAPVCTICVGDAVLKIGNETEMTKQYYLYMGGDQVYLVDATVVTPFLHTLADLTAFEEIPELSGISQVKITTQTETRTLSYADQWYLDDQPASQETATALVDALDAMRWQYCVEYKAKDLAVYGLDAPAVAYEISYGAGETITILLGDRHQFGMYAMIAGSHMVYNITSEQANALTRFEKM